MNTYPLTFVIGKSWHVVCVFFHILHRQYISALPSTTNINIKRITTTTMYIQTDPEEDAMNWNKQDTHTHTVNLHALLVPVVGSDDTDGEGTEGTAVVDITEVLGALSASSDYYSYEQLTSNSCTMWWWAARTCGCNHNKTASKTELDYLVI